MAAFRLAVASALCAALPSALKLPAAGGDRGAHDGSVPRLPDLFGDFAKAVRESGFNVSDFLSPAGEPKRNADVTRYLKLLMDNREDGYMKSRALPDINTTSLHQAESPVNCTTAYFKGPRATPARMVMILDFSFEADLLEAQCYEYWDVVDEFVVFEGIYTQRGAAKPQVFPKLKDRLAPCMPKVRYYLQRPDEVKPGFKPQEMAPSLNSWVNEGIRDFAYARYVKDEAEAGRSLDNTLIVNADIDEFPPAAGLQRFKHCETEKLWASFCAVNYEPDFDHVQEFPDDCGKLGNHYWPFPNILRPGEPLRDHQYHKNMYDEMPGSHIHARDPWSTLARRLSTAEQWGLPEAAGANSHLLLDPYALYAQVRCSFLNKKQRFPVQRFPVHKTGDARYQLSKPAFLAANEARFPYMAPSKFPSWGDMPC